MKPVVRHIYMHNAHIEPYMSFINCIQLLYGLNWCVMIFLFVQACLIAATENGAMQHIYSARRGTVDEEKNNV